ncbi:hypothetical protein ACG0Z5_10710 [Scandinavium sp. M-37]|uniref:hypothetical protein n=1 Tax=Scandinavium sp. M-37 TaxID=3373077 RepID=UPI003746C612
MSRKTGGALESKLSYVMGEHPTTTITPHSKGHAGTVQHEIHAFKCDGAVHLFVWVNSTGVKFYSFAGESYSICKDMFLSRANAELLERHSGYLRGLVRLDDSIIAKVETFTL